MIMSEPACEGIQGRNLFAADYISDSYIANKDVLDIGCGSGWFENNALCRGCKSITGVDISQKHVKTARTVIEDPRSELVVGSAIHLPFYDAQFDAAVSWEVLEHLPARTEGRFFGEVYRVLKRGGVFCFSTPNSAFFAKLLDPAWLLTRHRHYRTNELIATIRLSGFQIEDVDIRGRFPELLAGIDLLVAKWVFRRDMFFKKAFGAWQKREFEKPGFTGIFAKLRKA